MAGKRKQSTTGNPPAKRQTRGSKQSKDDVKDDDKDNDKEESPKADGWDFLKAPSKEQLKKKPAKKASVPAEDTEFPPLSEEDKHAFDDIIPLPSSTAQHRIVAWNVNGLRAVLKKDNYFRAYIAREDPDILCLSETKIDQASLGAVRQVLPQYPHQYWRCATQKGYSGTVIFSKVEPLSVLDEIVLDGKVDDEGRFIALEFERYWVVHTYVPNSGQKLDRLEYRTKKWDVAMFEKLKELEKTKPVIWCGDLNVAHQEIDIHDPKNNHKSAGFTDKERESFGTLLQDGFVDTFRHKYPEKQEYSYFSYRFGARGKNKGWRLDYFVTSSSLLPHIEDSCIRSAITGSDHLPIALTLTGF
ncbi:exodeoxyribonuclease [Thraustotheca clavata]|uniref:DNA-(apurinic or apyrimidinic site) endonuclease n=1 Tax=Thraustotheca clavata TaxID=74557 RepID=A0A1W0A8P7_9STRA|nr:exodeoxyribonuclease [Thraustotheca clavata]